MGDRFVVGRLVQSRKIGPIKEQMDAVDNFVDSAGWYGNIFGQAILANIQRLKKLFQQGPVCTRDAFVMRWR